MGKVKTRDARDALASVAREQLAGAAGPDGRVSRKDERALDPFLRAAVAEARAAAPRGHVNVDEAVEHAVAAAVAAWSRFNQASGPGAVYLSQREVAAIETELPELGRMTRLAVEIAAKKAPQPAAALPNVALVDAPAGASVSRRGDVFTFRASNDVPVNTLITVDVDGHRGQIRRFPRGFLVADLLAGLPAGYGGEVVATRARATGIETDVRITRAAAGELSVEDAQRRTEAALVEHIQTTRMTEPDWLRYFPATWAENVERGIMAGIRRFADPANAAELEVHARPDKFIFTGRGPYDLYTEVEVAVRDGRILRTYVEID